MGPTGCPDHVTPLERVANLGREAKLLPIEAKNSELVSCHSINKPCTVRCLHILPNFALILFCGALGILSRGKCFNSAVVQSLAPVGTSTPSNRRITDCAGCHDASATGPLQPPGAPGCCNQERHLIAEMCCPSITYSFAGATICRHATVPPVAATRIRRRLRPSASRKEFSHGSRRLQIRITTI